MMVLELEMPRNAVGLLQMLQQRVGAGDASEQQYLCVVLKDKILGGWRHGFGFAVSVMREE